MTDNGTALATVERRELVSFTQQQLQLLRTSFGSPLSDPELAYFEQVCKRTGLDPFRKQVYAVKRGGRLTIQTGIDGFRAIAERSGLYEGQTPAMWCGEDGAWKDVWLSNTPPAAAKVGVYRKGFREPIVAVARFASYTAKENLWLKMPEVMIAKCAEALALRKAFPEDLGGLYSKEEMAQAENEETSDGLATHTEAPKGRASGNRSVTTAGGGSGEPAPIPHDHETGEVEPTPVQREINASAERVRQQRAAEGLDPVGHGDRPSPAQSARMMQRERELIECGTLQALAKVWHAIGADARSTAITLTQRAELSKVKDRCKKNLEDAQRAEEERANELGDDPGNLGPDAGGP